MLDGILMRPYPPAQIDRSAPSLSMRRARLRARALCSDCRRGRLDFG